MANEENVARESTEKTAVRKPLPLANLSTFMAFSFLVSMTRRIISQPALCGQENAMSFYATFFVSDLI